MEIRGMLTSQRIKASNHDSFQFDVGEFLAGDFIHRLPHPIDLYEPGACLRRGLRLYGQCVELCADQPLLRRQLESVLLVQLRPR